MRPAPWGEFHTASILDGDYSPLAVGLKISRDPDFVPRPRVFVDPPSQSVTPLKSPPASQPQTKGEALKATTDAASGQQTPKATVSPLLVGGIALGLFGLYFFGN